MEVEDSWIRASSDLDVSSKIYSLRVDNLHGESLRVAGGVGRTEKASKEKEKEPVLLLPADGDNPRAKTLERNVASITLTKFDLQFQIDPLFSSNQSKFDSGKSMLSKLRVSSCLELKLGAAEEAETFAKSNTTVRLGKAFDCPADFSSVSHVRRSLLGLAQEEEERTLDALIRGVGLLQNAVEKGLEGVELENVCQLMLQEKEERDERGQAAPPKVLVKKVRTVRAPPQLKSAQGFLEDAKNWMGKEEMKFLRSKTEDQCELLMVNFYSSENLDIEEVLPRVSRPDRDQSEADGLFLLPGLVGGPKPGFLSEYFLKDFLFQPDEQPTPNQIIEHEYKKSASTIREIKESLKHGLAAESSFRRLWLSHCPEATPQVGFVALLHLANELGLRLEDQLGEVRVSTWK